MISRNSVKPDPCKLRALTDMALPKSKKELNIPGYHKLPNSLQEQLKYVSFWEEKHEEYYMGKEHSIATALWGEKYHYRPQTTCCNIYERCSSGITTSYNANYTGHMNTKIYFPNQF